MITSLPTDELKKYVSSQLSAFFPDGISFSGSDIDSAFALALERLEYCFSRISFPAYNSNGNTHFSHLHADQYTQFIYFLSNSLWKLSENKPVCDKLLQLNRVLNSIFISYKCKMPDIFFLGHPMGTILGNADYSDYLVVFQGVTVNTASDDCAFPAPHIKKGVFLAAGAKIIGNKTVGERTSVGVDALIYNEDVPPDSVVIRAKDGATVISPRKKPVCMAQNYFTDII